MKAKQIKCKLYLEGKEVKFTSVVIKEQINQPVQAQISMASKPFVLGLFPRTLAHLFFEDEMDNEYKLLFEGELVSKSYSREAHSSSVVLVFQSLSNNWDYCWKTKVNLSMMTYQTGIYVLADAGIKKTREGSEYGKVVGDNAENVLVKETVQGEKEGAFRKDAITKWQFLDLPMFANMDTAMEVGISRSEGDLSEALLGDDGFFNAIYSADKENPFNPYYKVVQEGLRLHDRIIVAPNTKTKEILQTKNVIKLVLSQYESLPDLAKVSDLIRSLLTLINFRIVEIAAPAREAVTGYPKSVYMVPDTWSFIPPRSNLIFPDQVENLRFTDDEMKAPTRMVVQLPHLMQSVGVGEVEQYVSAYFYPPMTVDETGHHPKFKLTDMEKISGVVPTPRIPMGTFVRMINELTDTTQQNIQNGGVPSGGQGVMVLEQVNKQHYEPIVPSELLKNSIENQYWGLVNQTKRAVLTTAFSPYRLIGMPCFYISGYEEETPSFGGVLVGRTVNIDANGQARESLDIGGAYYMWPYSYYHDTFNAMRIRMPQLAPEWFDQRYDPEYVGAETVTVEGEEDDGFYKKFMQIAREGADWDGFSAFEFTYMYGSDIDEKRRNAYLEAAQKFRAGEISYSSFYAAYVKIVANIIENLGLLYENWKAEGKAHTYIDNVLWRDLMGEKGFWKFLCDNEDGPTEDNYRDADDLDETNLAGVSFASKPFLNERVKVVEQLVREQNNAV